MPPIKINPAYKKQCVKDMTVGQTGYVVPWAFSTNSNGELFVNNNYSISPTSGGTAHVKIGKTPYGFYVDSSTFEKGDFINDVGCIKDHSPIEFDGEPTVWELAEIALKNRDFAVMKQLFK